MQAKASGATASIDWIDIGPLEAIPQLGARVIRMAAGDIAVFRTADDEVFALRDRCPHKGGPLSQGIVYGKKVACPLHNWSIHLDSGIAVAPDEGCANTFATKLSNGRIYLRLSPGDYSAGIEASKPSTPAGT